MREQLSGCDRGLIFALIHYLLPYFAYASIKGSSGAQAGLRLCALAAAYLISIKMGAQWHSGSVVEYLHRDRGVAG